VKTASGATATPRQESETNVVTLLALTNRTGNSPHQMQEFSVLQRRTDHGISGGDKKINLKKLWHTNLYIPPWRPPLVDETDTLKVLMAL
jgi:hypothetical protein